MPTRLSLSLFVIYCGLTSSSAHAQVTGDSMFDARLMLGVGGEADVDAGSLMLGGVVVQTNVSQKLDLENSLGAGVSYVHFFHKNFGLGGLFAFHSWQTESGDQANDDRNTVLDLSVLPQGVLPITSGVDIYASLPLGLSLDFYNEYDPVAVQVMGIASVNADVDTAIGFNYGLLLGVRFGLWDEGGLLAELGYLGHSFDHEVTVDAVVLGASTSASADLSFSYGQLALNVGAFF